MKCVLIGYGKVAQAIIDNFDIDTCFARRLSQMDNLINLRCCKFIDSYDMIPNADLYIICVNDDSINQVLENLKTKISKYSIVAHTSGSVSLDVISRHFQNAAVIYPLYPFTKTVSVNFDDVTMLIESTNSYTDKIINAFLDQKKCTIHQVDSMTRVDIHISAVFACNFVNHLIVLSERYLKNTGCDIEIITPLIKQTFENILQTKKNREKLQTGPAIREEYDVINSHLNKLKNNTRMLEVYKTLTDSIIELKNGDKKL